MSDRAALAFLALAINLLLASALTQRLHWHPQRRFEYLLTWLERKLNRNRRSEQERRFRGILIVFILCGIGLIASGVLAALAERSKIMAILEIAALAGLLPVRPLLDDAMLLRQSLESGRLSQAHAFMSRVLHRNNRSLDAHAMARAGMEFLAERFSSLVVAPVFWFLLLGLPGLILVRMIELMDAAWRTRSSLHHSFGWAASKFCAGMLWAPSWIASGIFALASIFIPGASPAQSLVCLRRDALAGATLFWGRPVASVAGALGVTLGGPQGLRNRVINNGWIGVGSAKISASDLRRGVMLYGVSVLILMLLLAFFGYG